MRTAHVLKVNGMAICVVFIVDAIINRRNKEKKYVHAHTHNAVQRVLHTFIAFGKPVCVILYPMDSWMYVMSALCTHTYVWIYANTGSSNANRSERCIYTVYTTYEVELRFTLQRYKMLILSFVLKKKTRTLWSQENPENQEWTLSDSHVL